ncbi:efflux RND transporter periplasmic adaptor subunit [Ralstonia insidiosa]|uniref:Efflux RND transporter periplasmic adaptor subunit n=1 Tax=Ralstonia insidiosa TaxID=190721 RepID=A0A848P535_9RALS|nr:efflux RND transporter periplasmic adaptor subunit [Ralstonia insidiosa]NMV38738.1 efflux RND transporter periplasmic adaptor subunit [Ralstonia insidiosa]
MQASSTSSKRLFYSAITLAVAGVCLWGALSLHAKEPSTQAVVALQHKDDRIVVPDASPLRRSLVVTAASEDAVSAAFVLPASVEADPGKLVKVLPPLSGRIVSLNKQLGDEVKAGDVLFTLDSADLAEATSTAAKAQAALVLAKKNLDRLHELDKSEITPRRDLEQAQNDYAQAVSEAERANNKLAQLGAKGGAKVSGGHILSVRSPISGRVVDLNGATGGYWNDSNASVMTVADLSRVFVTANVQEKDLSKVYVGQAAAVKLDAYAEPLAAKVRYVGEMLDADTRTVKVRMVFDNKDGRLKPGMFAQATLQGQPHTGVIVPMSALVQSGFNTRTFVEVAPWQFQARVVKTGAQVGDKIEILSGLKAGERVVTKDGVLLND